METRKIISIEESIKRSKREKIIVIIGAILLVAILLGLQYYLDETAIRENNCDVCASDYLQPQCRSAACEPVIQAFK